MDELTPSGLSRRDLLKRGAVVGVAAAWTVPLVQVVSMSPASAASPSSPGGGGGGGGPKWTPSDTPSATATQTSPHPTTSATTTTATSSVEPTTTTATTTSAPTTSAASHGVDAASVTQDNGALAFTGTDLPVKPTVVAGLAAIAVGAGALAASRSRNTGAHEATRNDD